jgi:hypothetical protein
MKLHLESVPGIESVATRRMDNGELVFTLGRTLEVIEACTSAGIAVLGVEVFPGLNVSSYDSYLKDQITEAAWPGYVRANNALAEDFIRGNPAPSTDECVLTTASWREFLKIEELRRVK